MRTSRARRALLTAVERLSHRRRRFSGRLAAASLVLAATLLFLELPMAGAAKRTTGSVGNPVQIENQRPGNAGWSAPQAPGRAIEGYASEVSVAPGGTIQLHVSTLPAARYRVEVFRLGWYQGMGGRLVGCLPSCTSDEIGAAQPLPPFDPGTGLLQAGWPVTDRVPVGVDWLSGYYVVKLVLTGGGDAGLTGTVPFVVTAPPGRASAILVQAPVNTWQAYNRWGGRSLYFNFSGIGDNHVSFDRPYSNPNLPQTSELTLVHFLERGGYDVSYTTDVDTDRNPAELLRHRLVITAGHGEYWTKGIRDAFERARDLGTNLAFMGANTGYWQIRYEDGRRTIVEYRHAGYDPEPDPALKTTRFRVLAPPRPECQLLGVQFQDTPGAMSQGLHDYTVNAQALADPWFANTGFSPGSTLAGLLGDEWDAIQPGCDVPQPTVLFQYGGPPANGDAVRYVAPSGARVFSSGSFHFSWGLDGYRSSADTKRGAPDPRLQRFMRNALDDLTRPAPPISARAVPVPGGIRIFVSRHADPRVVAVLVFRADQGARPVAGGRGATLACVIRRLSCLDRDAPQGRLLWYTAVTRDRWRVSQPTAAPPVADGRMA